MRHVPFFCCGCNWMVWLAPGNVKCRHQSPARRYRLKKWNPFATLKISKRIQLAALLPLWVERLPERARV
jgi:hypothetical protein